MDSYTINNVSGIPCSLRNTTGIVMASIDSVTPVTCYNERDVDDNGKPGPMMLIFKAKIYLTNHGFKNTQRVMSMRLSAKYNNGLDLSGNPNELTNAVFILCNYNNYEQEVIFRAHDFSSGGCAADIAHVHFSFFHDPNAWVSC